MATTIGKLVYQIQTTAELRGITATKAELAAAKKVFHETRTDAERFGLEVSKLDNLMRKGAISGEEYTRKVHQLQSAFSGANAGPAALVQSLSGVAPGLAAIANPATAAVAAIGAVVTATTAAATGLVAVAAAGVKEAAAYEQTKVSFETMLGSAGGAKAMLQDLSDFAVATPFEFKDLTGATQKLIAFGVAQEDMLPTLRALGDLGAGLNIPIGELAEIYGKARVQGRLFAQDINQLTGRGIPIIQELAKQFGVAESEVKGLVESGQVGFANLEKAVFDLTEEGAKFGGLMEKQSGTLGGMYSTLSDEVSLSLRQIGEALIEEFDLKSVMQDLIAFAGTFRSDVIPEIQTAIAMVHDIGEAFLTLDAALGGPLSMLKDLASGFQDARLQILELQKLFAEKTGNKILAETAQQEIDRIRKIGEAAPKRELDTARPDRPAKPSAEQAERAEQIDKLQKQIDAHRAGLGRDDLSDTMRKVLTDGITDMQQQIERLQKEPTAAAQPLPKEESKQPAPRPEQRPPEDARRAVPERREPSAPQQQTEKPPPKAAAKLSNPLLSPADVLGAIGSMLAPSIAAPARIATAIAKPLDKPRAEPQPRPELPQTVTSPPERSAPIEPKAVPPGPAMTAEDARRALQRNLEQIDAAKRAAAEPVHVPIEFAGPQPPKSQLPEPAVKSPEQATAAVTEPPPPAAPTMTAEDARRALQRNLEQIDAAKRAAAEPVHVPIEVSGPSGTPADKMLAKLREDIANAGKSPIEIKLREIQKEGASPEQLVEAEKLLQQQEADKAAKKQADADAKARDKALDELEKQRKAQEAEDKRADKSIDSIRDRTSTPEEKARTKRDEDLAAVDAAQQRGLITAAEADNLVARLHETFGKFLEKQAEKEEEEAQKNRPAADNKAMAWGGAEAFRAISQAMQSGLSGNKANQKVEENTNRTAAAAEETVRNLRELITKLPSGPSTVRST